MRILFLFLLIISCSTTRKTSGIQNLEEVLNASEARATDPGRKVLTTGRSLIQNGTIIRGGCWDYANAVYNKAGYPPSERLTPLKSKFKGPYADSDSIEPGDWLYFINHSFRESDHSGIFVEWTDFEKRLGLIMSYVGGKKKTPGNYRVYDLSHVYFVMRAKN